MTETPDPTPESTPEPADESTDTPEPADESTETPEPTETDTPEPADESTETPEPTETEPETDQRDEPSGNRSEEYVADWTVSNEGTVDADRLLLTRLSVDVRGLNGSTREEALKSARITLARYEGDDVPGFPGTLWALARTLDERDIQLDSGDAGPELPAREAKVRTFELGVRFDYSELSGTGGYSIAASPEFTIEQS